MENSANATPRMSTKKLVMMGLLVALTVVLTYMLSFTTAFLRVSFGFIPVATAGMLFGPIGGLAVGTLADLIGATCFSAGRMSAAEASFCARPSSWWCCT